IFLWLCLTSFCYADDIRSVFFMGNYFYEQANYDEAIKQYNRILESGLESGNLYYNLGNCYFKKGQLGRAILNYEKARRIMPGDLDLDSNYKYALSLIKGPTIYPKRILFLRLLDNLFERFSIDGLTALLSAVYLSVLVILLVGVFFKPSKKYALAFAVILGILFVVGLAYLQKKISCLNREGIIIEEVADVKFEPKDSATTYFSLYEGMKVVIVSFQDDWCKVRRQDNKSGWVRTGALAIF
ncbi:MAG: tetratricopeptide repeat protein, partial [Candidatus Omnitrophica bacterium]|nr:tetratricopeptide repeat protein [Candidatus Omnitrophota bacterium]